jgi:hypothetical protein
LRISDLTGVGMSAIFTRVSDPHPLRESVGAGVGVGAGLFFTRW